LLILAILRSFVITQQGTTVDTEGRFLRDQEATNSRHPLQFSLRNYTVKPFLSLHPPPLPREGGHIVSLV
jgi:hypothetical protein